MATEAQMRMILLLEDLNRLSRQQTVKLVGMCGKGLNPTKATASRMISALVRYSQDRGVPTYKYRPGSVVRIERNDDGCVE